MKILLAIVLLILGYPVRAEDAPSQPAPFSAAKPGSVLPAGWTLTTLPRVPRATRFDVIRDEGQNVLRAVSESAAATLTHKLRVDTARTPWLAWRWKVTRVLDRADLTRKDGDDYAARVYVLFDYGLDRLSVAERFRIRLGRSLYGQDLPAAALCYVWDNRHPTGTSAWSAYTDRVRMIVVESGPERVGRWVTETRNVAADFRAVFGEEPPPIAGIALAADTDNTGESVVAYFGDVRFLSSHAESDMRP
ncbi:DUF3047 domain-containing protein [Methylocaldum sp.]|uniref:DUF3047 domain-containing protein n=1 Tax=Methylocaldum sp. TaxID=1969727 RepID=UPI002D222D23|nr:DUF3047 domain-containing protein [Methylocaldum sp.]HYE37363.1 DUF3047 domain-containing protein [Methylocaldum sp.]